MKNIDIRKLKEGMLAQDNAGTADPIYCVYEDREYPTTSDYSEEWSYADLYDGCNKIGQTKESLIEYYNDELDNGVEFNNKLTKEQKDSFDRNDMFEWLKNNSEHCNDYLEEIYFFVVEKFIAPFFTKKAAERFIEQNHYHYTNPHIYVNSLWRNYEMQEVRNYFLEYEDGRWIDNSKGQPELEINDALHVGEEDE